MDAHSGPMEAHLRRLVETLRPVIFGGGEPAAPPDDAVRRARGQLYARPGRSPGRRWGVAGKATGTVVLAGVAVAIWCRLLGVGQPRPAAAVTGDYGPPGGPLSGSIPVNPLPPPTPPTAGPGRPPETRDPPTGLVRPPPPPGPVDGNPVPDGGRPLPSMQGPASPEPRQERQEERQQERADALRAVQGLRLQSIVSSGPHKSCLIDGHIYAVGDSVDGLTIEAVRDRSLIVAKGPFRFEVTMGQ